MSETARLGSKVPITIRLRNSGDSPLELYLRGRTIAFDIVIADAIGRVVWRRLEGEVVPGIIQFKLLGAREALDLSHDWDQRTNRGASVGPGEYTARGILLTDGPEPLTSAPVPFRIVPD